MKKISMMLIMILLTASFTFGAAVPADIGGTEYEEAITTLFEKGIITGDVDGNFYPQSKLTRAQACIMIVKSMNPPASKVKGTATQPVKSGFPDMTGYGWAEGYIAYALEKGVVRGYPDGSFKPGNNVTIEELKAMVVRATGYTDKILGGKYPSNYNEKAEELGLMKDIFTIQVYPFYATKGITAQVVFNGLELIEKANPFEPGEIEGETPSMVPLLTGKTFATGDFNSTMTEFAGKKIASNVKVYTYGVKSDYKSTMTLSGNPADFRTDTIYKYKSANTPLWYSMYGGEINSIILPMDVGFSGNAYGVINGESQLLNGEKDSVKGLKTLVAGQPIMWLCQTDVTGIPANYFLGDVYKINMKNGQIKSVSTASSSDTDDFVELTTGFQLIYDYSNGLARLESASGELIEIKSNAAIYILSDDYDEYTVGKLTSIRDGKYIKAYDMTDDDDSSVDIVVITNEANGI